VTNTAMETQGLTAWLAVLSCLAFGFAGCRSDTPRNTGSPRTLRVLYDADEQSLYPGSDDVPLRLVFSPFVSYATLEKSYCWEPEQGLAERWEHSPDWRTWTVRLREGLQWHDGAPVTAEDVRFTVELWRHPDVRHWAGESIDSVVVIDNRTFRIHYRRPSREVLNGWDVFYPAHLLRGLDPRRFWDWGFWERPVGNGPFRYLRSVPQTMMTFAPHAAHPLANPGLDRLIVKWGGASALTELESGSVDAVEGVSPGDAARLRGNPLYRVHLVSLSAGVSLFWNTRVAPFDRASVRRALTMAIDRRELHRSLDLPDDLPLTDGIHTPCQFARSELRAPLPFDPVEAGRLLTEAGWTDRDGDGIRDRGGSRFMFTVTVPTDWLQAREAAVYLQQALRSVGVAMEIETLERRVVSDRLNAGNVEALIWIAGQSADQHLRRFGTGSPLGFENPRLNSLLEAAREAMDPTVEDSLYRLASEVFEREMPATWLYPKVDFSVTRANVRGYDAAQGDLFMNLGRVWLEEP